MDILKKVNGIRRSLMHAVTKNIGKTNFNKSLDNDINAEVKRVLICRPNHRLGNLLLITPLVEEVNAHFPDATVDLFVKGGLASIVFKNHHNIGNIIPLPKKPFKELIKYIKVWIAIKRQHYDIVINIDSKSSSGKISTQWAHSRYKFFGEENEDAIDAFKDGKHMAKRPVYNFRINLNKIGFKTAINDEIPPLNIRLTQSEIEEGKRILHQMTGMDSDKKTISIFTYATGKKCYSQEWWLTFYEKLKIQFSNYNIIEILPVENISQIEFKAVTFYSKDIRQIGAVIANTEVFIGADSGIMHLASAVQTPTLGLFSVTSPSKYEPYGNKSLAIDTNKNDSDDCIKILREVLLG